ncbi:TolC family protein [Nitrospira moscoviensis]|jgi:outer membrane protein TolC|uniref:Putative heavy metal efflux pump protein CzcC n=1 Tax=Nitrospira moscoviensis TaxID=42253 RepID=A0A0K2GFD8_NITMO|nr:TolC family protein [Nitrospira moscoviensis]ALA59317.1 putative heavy metal efflux pump protein CzcC [Nitrospira moscoviensis]
MKADHLLRGCLSLVLIGALAGTAQAAPPLDIPLELADLMQEALARNPEIQAAHQQWEASKERVPQAGTLPDPTFGVQLWNFPENGNLLTSPGRTQNTILTLAQKFPFPGKLPLNAEVANRAAGIREQAIRAKEREILARLKQAYYELYLAHKEIEVHHDQIDIVRQLFDAATAKFRAGQGTQVDVLKAQVELSDLYQRLPVLEQRRETAAAKVNTILNRDPRTPLGRPREPAVAVPEKPIEALEQVAETTRPELKAASLSIERSRQAVAYAKRQYYPDFEVAVQRFQNYQAVDGFGAIGIMSIPFSFWTKSKYDAGVREAKATEAAARAELQTWQNVTRFQISELLAKVHAQQQVVDLYRTTILPQAEQNMEAARAGYRTGRNSFLDFLEAERAWLEFRLAYYRALTERESQFAVLEQVVGTLL